jgi:hypothetical protein
MLDDQPTLGKLHLLIASIDALEEQGLKLQNHPTLVLISQVFKLFFYHPHFNFLHYIPGFEYH